jgi:tryptophan 2,3-dioxygenase
MITKEEVFEGDYSHFDVLMLLERIAELEEKLWNEQQESKQAVERAIGFLLEKDERIAELEKELSDLIESIEREFG